MLYALPFLLKINFSGKKKERKKGRKERKKERKKERASVLQGVDSILHIYFIFASYCLVLHLALHHTVLYCIALSCIVLSRIQLSPFVRRRTTVFLYLASLWQCGRIDPERPWCLVLHCIVLYSTVSYSIASYLVVRFARHRPVSEEVLEGTEIP